MCKITLFKGAKKILLKSSKSFAGLLIGRNLRSVEHKYFMYIYRLIFWY